MSSLVRLEPRVLLQPGAITPLFQPILELNDRGPAIVAFEALARGPAGSALESPLALFSAARQAGLVPQLDRLCIVAALEAARALPAHALIFLNVHPLTLCEDVQFPAFLADVAARVGFAPSRLTLEILEHSRVTQSQCPQLRAALHVLRGHGMRLAVDDVSGATDDVRRALSLRPEFLKVEADVVRGADADGRPRALLHAIAEEAARKGARVVAEGVESPRDLEVAASAGISLAQGFLLGRPAPAAAFTHFLPSSESTD